MLVSFPVQQSCLVSGTVQCGVSVAKKMGRVWPAYSLRRAWLHTAPPSHLFTYMFQKCYFPKFSAADTTCDNTLDPDTPQFIVWAVGGVGATAFKHFNRASSKWAIAFYHNHSSSCQHYIFCQALRIHGVHPSHIWLCSRSSTCKSVHLNKIL